MNASAQSGAVRLLVIDDTPSIHEDFRKILVTHDDTVSLDVAETDLFGVPKADHGTSLFTLDCALQGQQGLALVQEAVARGQPYALAFVDMRMPPGWDGIETIRHLWQSDPALQVVICTAYSDYSWAETVRHLGRSDNFIILKKPFDNIEVLQLAHALARKWQLARENSARLASLDELVRVRTHELELAEERFAKAFSASPLAQVIIALDTMEVIDGNPAFERALQSERSPAAAPAGPVRQLDPVRWRALLHRLAANEPVDDFEFVYEAPPNVRRDLRCSSRSITIAGRSCALCLLRDVTEQLQLEQRFFQAQKMEAIGQLAAGVAHDFNNVLTVIQSYIGFVLDDPALSQDHRSSLDHVHTAAERAASLTRQLLAFSRRQITQPTRLDVAVVLGNFRKMLARLVPERIALEFECAPNLPPIVADAANLEHVIMNLVVNARDALPGSGRIVVSASAVMLDEAAARRHPDARAGRFVRLAVADNGTGIDPELLPRIFEPFFTTKDVGQGTGLGLSTAYGIVRQHEGWIEVASTVGRGTTFALFFPACTDATDHTTPAGDSFAPAVSRGRGERILIAEDDPSVRLVVHAVVSRAGYDVTAADDGPSALAAWEAAGHRFDLLLTDVVMPNGVSGVELAERLRQDAPTLKVILTTGYSQELLKRKPGQLSGATILLKPYSVDAVLQGIRAALDAPAGSAGARDTPSGD